MKVLLKLIARRLNICIVVTGRGYLHISLSEFITWGRLLEKKDKWNLNERSFQHGILKCMKIFRKRNSMWVLIRRSRTILDYSFENKLMPYGRNEHVVFFPLCFAWVGFYLLHKRVGWSVMHTVRFLKIEAIYLCKQKTIMKVQCDRFKSKYMVFFVRSPDRSTNFLQRKTRLYFAINAEFSNSLSGPQSNSIPLFIILIASWSIWGPFLTLEKKWKLISGLNVDRGGLTSYMPSVVWRCPATKSEKFTYWLLTCPFSDCR